MSTPEPARETPAPTALPGDRPRGVADFLPSPFFVLLLGLTGIAGWLSWRAAEVEWTGDPTVRPLLPPLAIILAWLIVLALHEYAHALPAYRSGDRALRGSGYLRLNPFGFRDLFAGAVLPTAYLVLGGFGMTGPATYVDRSAVGSRARRFLIALAGPLATLLVAAALVVVVSLLVPAGQDTDNWAIAAMAFVSYAAFTAAVINLLPLPGLDGFDALAPFLPEQWVERAEGMRLFGSIAVFAVLWFPVVNAPFTDAMEHLLNLLTPNPLYNGFIFHGLLLLEFWA